jgi:uncharacterized damage-inducible protein DinB
MEMMFHELAKEIIDLTSSWENKLLSLPEEVITQRRNSQNRTIKQIVGHLVDSASNNIHRTVHLQYRETPLDFPNYATFGNNDKWIAIQNYQDENWRNLVQLWKFSILHFAHVIQQIDPKKIDNVWLAGEDEKVTLKEMVEYFLPHLKLHLREIEELAAPPNLPPIGGEE